MHKLIKIIAVCLSAFILNSCAQAMDKTLSPPSDTKWVNVEVKNPSRYTKPFPLEVTYISHKCLKNRTSGFDGSSVTEPSYNGTKIPLEQQGKSDVWIAKVAMRGGGSCDWTLSEFNLGIEYIDATHLGEDLAPGAAVGATIAFDNDASRNGQFTFVKGDVRLTPKYYPYIREWHLVRQKNELTFLAKERFFSYRAEGATAISYMPMIDESKVVRYIEPRKKTDDSHPTIIYPDGTVVSDGSTFPDFDKVEGMKSK